MEKRAFKRIPIHLYIRFFCGDSCHNGLVTNISENGMHFISGADLSSGLNIDISMPLKEESLKIPVRIIRSEKTGNLYDGFSAEISSPLPDYIGFIESLKNSL